MSEKMDYKKIIDDLNQELYERFGEAELSFSYMTNGYVDCILFEDTMIWCSEMNDREWIEDDSDYEPFEPFIKKAFNNWIKKLYTLKF